MNNILFVIPDNRFGGAENMLVDLINKHHSEGNNCHLLTLFKSGVLVNTFENICKSTSYVFPNKNIFKWIKYIRNYKSNINEKFLDNTHINKIIEDNNIDTVYFYLEGAIAYAGSFFKNDNVKKIAWIHRDLNYNNMIHDVNYLNSYDQINVINNEIEKQLVGAGISANKIVFVENYIDKDKILKLSMIPHNEKFNAYFRKKTITSIGRLDDVKNYDGLINDLKDYILESDINLLIIGEGRKRKKLTKLIKKNQLKNNVFLLGNLVNPYPLVKKSNVFISYSKYEGYGNAIAEAKILNSKIICSNTIGANIICNKYTKGKIINNSNELIKTIKEMI